MSKLVRRFVMSQYSRMSKSSLVGVDFSVISNISVIKVGIVLLAIDYIVSLDRVLISRISKHILVRILRNDLLLIHLAQECLFFSILDSLSISPFICSHFLLVIFKKVCSAASLSHCSLINFKLNYPELINY